MLTRKQIAFLMAASLLIGLLPGLGGLLALRLERASRSTRTVETVSVSQDTGEPLVNQATNVHLFDWRNDTKQTSVMCFCESAQAKPLTVVPRPVKKKQDKPLPLDKGNTVATTIEIKE